MGFPLATQGQNTLYCVPVKPSSYLLHVAGRELEESKAGLHERLLAEVETNGFDEEKINQSLSPDYKPDELQSE